MARILLADDEAATRDLGKRALEADGHAVTCTACGSDALDQLSQNASAYDVLVTDLNMPGIDGVELATRALAINPRLGIVLMSGLIEHLSRIKELGSQKSATIAKPFTLEQLRASIRSVA